MQQGNRMYKFPDKENNNLSETCKSDDEIAFVLIKFDKYKFSLDRNSIKMEIAVNPAK